jgi:hypothetical protein
LIDDVFICPPSIRQPRVHRRPCRVIIRAHKHPGLGPGVELAGCIDGQGDGAQVGETCSAAGGPVHAVVGAVAAAVCQVGFSTNWILQALLGVPRTRFGMS